MSASVKLTDLRFLRQCVVLEAKISHQTRFVRYSECASDLVTIAATLFQAKRNNPVAYFKLLYYQYYHIPLHLCLVIAPRSPYMCTLQLCLSVYF
jgi:hypothetical protein